MNHTKYRVWLISITLAAVIFGVIWYVSGREEEKTITDGTLVYHELPEEACFPGRSRMAREVRLPGRYELPEEKMARGVRL